MKLISPASPFGGVAKRTPTAALIRKMRQDERAETRKILRGPLMERAIAKRQRRRGMMR